MTNTQNKKNIFSRKLLLGIALGLVLSIILLNVDKKLWLPLEFESINSRNVFKFGKRNKSLIDNVVVILFDDKTRFLLRQNGLPIKNFEEKGKDLLDTAINKLESVKAKSIGINFNLNNSPNPLEDYKLAKTISMFNNIVVAESVYSFNSYKSKTILKNAKAIGFGELYKEYDKVVHKIRLKDDEYDGVPSFAYELYKISTKRDIDENLKKKNLFYLNYPEKAINVYSLIDLLGGNIGDEVLKDKVIILGNGLKSKLMKDKLDTPYAQNVSDSEVQAVALLNLLQNKYLSRFSLIDFPLLFILISVFFGVLFTNLQIFRGTTLFIILLSGLLISNQLFYSKLNLIIEFVPVCLTLLFNFVIGSLINLQFNLFEQKKELELSQEELSDKNKELSTTLQELKSKVEELREVRKLLSYRREEERKRIARDLHDDTLARLTDLKRHVELIVSSKENTDNELKSCIGTLDSVTQEIRRIINALRPSMLDNVLGLIPAIENLLDDLSKRSKKKIETKFIPLVDKLELDDSSEIQLYRIVQEALNNVYKHSSASKVEIQIDKQPGQLLILISDNGIGINNGNGNGFGLVDMKERADLIGAHIQHINKPNNNGTVVEIILPLSKSHS